MQLESLPLALASLHHNYNPPNRQPDTCTPLHTAAHTSSRTLCSDPVSENFQPRGHLDKKQTIECHLQLHGEHAHTNTHAHTHTDTHKEIERWMLASDCKTVRASHNMYSQMWQRMQHMWCHPKILKGNLLLSRTAHMEMKAMIVCQACVQISLSQNRQR